MGYREGPEKARARLQSMQGAGGRVGSAARRQTVPVGFQSQAGERTGDMGVAAQPPEQMAWPGQSLDMRAGEPDQSCGIGNGKFKREGHITNAEQQVWQV